MTDFPLHPIESTMDSRSEPDWAKNEKVPSVPDVAEVEG